MTDAPSPEFVAAVEAAGLLRDEYPDQMAARSCTCTPDAMCGAHRLLDRYEALYEHLRDTNSAKRDLRAAVAAANQRTEQAEAARDALQAMVDGCRELVGDYHSQLSPGSGPVAHGLHEELAEVVGYPEDFRALVADQPATRDHPWTASGGEGTATIVSRIGGPAFAVHRHGQPDIGIAEAVAAALNQAPWISIRPALVADQPATPDPAWPDETRRQPDQEHT